MSLYFDYRCLSAPERLEAHRPALLRTAQGLRTAAQANGLTRLLQGKNIALLCEAPDLPDAALFERAASAVGARVARIRPSEAGLSAGRHLNGTARMLGRLYDAIECQGMDADVVDYVASQAGVPVYNGIGSRDHVTAHWAWELDDQAQATTTVNGAPAQQQQQPQGCVPPQQGQLACDACREAVVQSILVSTLR